MIIHQCDKCGKNSTQKKGESASTPPGWYLLAFKMGYGYSSTVYYDICAECRISLGIPDSKPEENVADRLIEILSEIVQDEIANT